MKRLDIFIRYAGAAVLLVIALANILVGMGLAPLGFNVIHVIGGVCLGVFALRTVITKRSPA